MENAEVLKLIKQGESETVEFKKSTSEIKEATISIASILNKHMKGDLFFGIANDGRIYGQTIGKDTLRDVSKAVSDNIEPKIYPEIHRVTVDGKDCIHVSFEGDERPYFAYGRTYVRVADEDKRLGSKELEKLFLKKNEWLSRWDKQYSDIPMKQINDKLLKDYVEKARSAGRISFGYKDVQSTLRKLKLVREKKILKAAEVLFSDDNSLEMQAAVFAGTDKTTFIDIKVFKGTIFDILKQSEEYISEKMNWRVEFRDFKRVEIPEIPTNAIREAVVNSLCHRDYFRADANKIAIFKDRITIYNPGEFPSGVEPQDFIMETADSMQRNPLIAEIMYYSKDIERWGTGIKRIHDECAKNSVKVDFKRCKGGFSVVFYRKTIFEGAASAPANAPANAPVKLTGLQEQLLTLIKQEPKATLDSLAGQSGKDRSTVRRNIAKLKGIGILRRVGSDKDGYWEIVKADNMKVNTL